MNDYAWLKALKPGDDVLVRRSGISGYDEPAKVERITPSGIIIVQGERYDGSAGYLRGDRYRRKLVESTPERVKEIEDTRRQRLLAGKMIDVRWRELPLETLERVAAALDAGEVAP